MLFRKRAQRTPQADPQVVETVRASMLFDADWYLHRYPEVAAFRSGPLMHFCEYGLFEHRDPGPNFSTRRYLENRPEAGRGPQPPFLHAIASGLSESRKLWLSDDPESLRWLLERSGLFDEQWYAARHYDVRRSGMAPIRHFVLYGAAEQRDPSPDFDSESYIDRHPDFQLETRSAVEHYLRTVERPERSAYAATSSYHRWVAAFDTLTDADRERICADAAREPLPPIVGFRLGSGSVSRESSGEIIRQIGVTWCEHEVRRSSEATAALHGLPAGSLILLYGADVQLRPHAAYVLASIMRSCAAEAAYADHDHVTGDGARIRPIFKPAMSPEFMARLPYAGPLAAIRTGPGTAEIVASAVDCAMTRDAATAIAEVLGRFEPLRVTRAPYVLYSLPSLRAATGQDSLEPVPDADKAVSPEAAEKYEPDLPTVRIIIPTRDRVGLLKACVESILLETDYPGALYRIAIVDNDSIEPETEAYFDTLAELDTVTVVTSPGPFNFSKVCNDGAAAADAEILVFLNNDMTVRQRNWLRRLVGFARQAEIGAVGAQLLYPDDAVQHGGTVLGVQIVGAHRLHGMDASEAARRDVTREMMSVTGACLAVRREVFAQAGGFDTNLHVAFNDVKLCLDIHLAGYRNIYVAEPLLYHHESISRGTDNSREKRRRNSREAIYVRERYADLLRDDPSYNPNLSLQKVGALAFPPRRVRPWRRSTEAGRVMLLSWTHDFGSGVAMVIAQQAALLRRRGWDVFIGGPVGKRDIDYPGCERVPFRQTSKLADYAVSQALDCVVAHTPPYFSLSRYFGAKPLLYFYDHGEPWPHLFPTRDEREDIDWEKRMCAPGARRVFTISQAIYQQQYRRDAIVLRNGNSHLAAWNEDRVRQRAALRRKLGFTGRFVVLNVCRFGRDDRFYKGIDAYIELAQQTPFSEPGLAGHVLFVLAGRSEAEDVAYVRSRGVRVFSNISDAEIIDLYAAADVYINLSQWEGYNLGIGQARAMGLHAIASDIPAHREFGIPVSNSVPELCALLGQAYRGWDESAEGRQPIIEPWDIPLTRFYEIMEADLTEDRESLWA